MLNGLNIEPTIQISKNASIKTKECPLRRNEVLLIRKIGYEKWKQLETMDSRGCLFFIKWNVRRGPTF